MRKKINYPFCLIQVLSSIAIALFIQVGSLFMPGTDTVCAQTTDSSSSVGGAVAQKTDEYHQKVDKYLLNSAEWLDSFFQSEAYTSEVNQTYMRIRLDGFIEDGESVDGKARFRLKLRLPGAEKRFRLVVGSDPNEADSVDDSPIESSRQRTDDDTGGTLGLEFFGLNTDKYNLKFSGGIRYRDSEIVGYGSTRFRYLKEFDNWAVRFTERLRYYTDDGWESRTHLDFERPVGDDMFLRITPSLEWLENKGVDDDEDEIGYDNEGGFYYNLTTSLFRPVSIDTAVEFQFNNYFDTELTGQLLESNLRIRFRQRLWREWLVLEVAPQLAWYEERDYETVLGILIRLEVYFGGYKTEEQEIGLQ